MYRYNTSISEALKQGAFDFDISNDYHYIKVGDTTVGQLKMAEILPDRNYGSLKTNKPDGLILHEKNTVIALVEYKKTGKINNLLEARKTIYDWYFKLADKLKCNVVCITDGENSYWFHTQSKNEITKDNGETF